MRASIRQLTLNLAVLALGVTIASEAHAVPPPVFVTTWGSSGSSDGLFDYPLLVATDAAGNLYVADYRNNRIQEFSPTGTYLAQWGSPGTDDGQFNGPIGVAIDRAGNVYVTDSGNDRIQKFASTGIFLTKWGSSGGGDGQFHFPGGIATDADDNVYVADGNNNRIQKFTSTGTLLTTWGSSGSGDGQFEYCVGVAIDAGGMVYVVDYGNGRIQKFTGTGAFLTAWGSPGGGDGQFSSPVGVATDVTGNVYVTDTNNARVQEFTSDGTLLTLWGSPGSGDGQFSLPQGIAIGSAGSVNIADTGNNRIQVFATNQVTPGAPAACITPAHPCVTVPVTIARADATPLRGYSVGLVVSGNLALCGGNIAEGSYLNGVGATSFQVLSNGGGSYTVDCAILGQPCGATASSGTLFTLQLASSAPSGTGTVTVTGVKLRDCVNGAVQAGAGPPASVTIDNTLPTAIAISAVQQRLGNDGDGTTKVDLSWTGTVAAGDSVLIYRAGYGSYPEYGAGGAAPAPPGYPPAAPWLLAALLTGGNTFDDETTVRDDWYYVAFVKDACGNVSPASNQTGGTLNYFLGDVSDGYSACQGNNRVGSEDISLLGANYGARLADPDALACLDVGPTTNGSVDSRPVPDDRLDFEDLVFFAINYGEVSVPQATLAPVAVGTDALSLDAPAEVAAGSTFAVTLRFSGSGAAQGISTQLSWDERICTPAAVESGALFTSQNGVVFSAGPGEVDAAALGAGHGITGEGVLATVRFRALASGDPNVALARAEARDRTNHPLVLGSSSVAAPTATLLAAPAPNPFAGATTLSFSLSKDGPVELAIYSVDGRRVASLASGAHAAGVYRPIWDGRDANGQPVRPGLYFVRLITAQGRFAKSVIMLR